MGLPLLLSATLILVIIVNYSILETYSTPGKTEVSRTISFPLNLNPGSAIHKNKGMGAASSTKATEDLLMKFLKS